MADKVRKREGGAAGEASGENTRAIAAATAATTMEGAKPTLQLVLRDLGSLLGEKLERECLEISAHRPQDLAWAQSHLD